MPVLGISRDIVLLGPGRDIARNKLLPELGILALDLRGIDFDQVKLGWGFDGF